LSNGSIELPSSLHLFPCRPVTPNEEAGRATEEIQPAGNIYQGEMIMTRKLKTAMALATLAFTLVLQPSVNAQQSMAKTLETGAFHGKVHNTSGRATIYQEQDGKLVLRLTSFKTSNGPDVHVILIAAKNADDDANFLKSNIERVELGKLKGNEGDQSYEIPEGTDLSKFQTVSIYCERFNANFGAAPLEKF
jgi:Electron transfer DM13